MSGVTKAVVCAILFVHIKEPLLLIKRVAPVVAAAGLLSPILNGHMTYNRK